MPLYQYQCIICNHEFENIRKSCKPNPECSKCRGETRKLPSVAGFRLKGGGWANDGYQKKE